MSNLQKQISFQSIKAREKNHFVLRRKNKKTNPPPASSSQFRSSTRIPRQKFGRHCENPVLPSTITPPHSLQQGQDSNFATGYICLISLHRRHCPQLHTAAAIALTSTPSPPAQIHSAVGPLDPLRHRSQIHSDAATVAVLSSTLPSPLSDPLRRKRDNRWSHDGGAVRLHHQRHHDDDHGIHSSGDTRLQQCLNGP